MKIIPRRGSRRQIARENATILWFCDEREKAQKLDPGLWEFEIHDDLAEETWPKVREAVLAEMRKTHAGCRPHFWWREWNGESRRLLSGAGSPDSDVHGFGIPYLWRGYSAADPPVFESQAAFLKRHGLLSADEERSADFSPETIEDRDAWTSYGQTYFKKHCRFVCVW